MTAGPPPTSLPSTVRGGENLSKKLLGSGSLYTLATIAPILSSLLVTPIVTRLLGPTAYGTVGIAITVYQLGLVVLALGLPTSITRHAIIERSGPAGALGLVILGAAAAAAAGLAVAVLSPFWAPALLRTSETWIGVWPAVSAVGLSVVMLAQAFLRGTEKVLPFVVVGALGALLPPLAGLIGTAMLGGEATFYLAGVGLGHAAAAAVALGMLVPFGRPTLTWADARSGLRIGLPTVPHQAAGALITSVLVVLAARLESSASAGQLQLSLLLGLAPMVILGAINNSWATLVFRTEQSRRADVLRDSTRLVSQVVLVLVVTFCAAAPVLVPLIGGPALGTAEAVQASQIAAATAAPMALYLANAHLVFLSGRTGLLAITTPISAAVALAAVLSVASGRGEADLRVLALGPLLFYVCQVAAAIALRRRAGQAAPRVGRALPYLAAASALAIALSSAQPSVPLGATAVAGSLALILVAEPMVRRRVQRILRRGSL